MRRHELCLRAFPPAWRRRYGAELLDLLADEPARPWAQSLDLIRAGLHERARRLDSTAARRVAAVLPAALAAVAIAPAALAPGTTPTVDGTPLAVAMGPPAGRGPLARSVTLRHTAPVVLRPKRLVSTPLRARSPAAVPERLVRHARTHGEHHLLARVVPAAARPRR